MRKKRSIGLQWLVLLFLITMTISGCDFDVSGPTYSENSILNTLKQYGITAHYPTDQGGRRVLTKATGERALLQVDYIDQYEVKGGWVEIYLYADPKHAYQEALLIRNDFDERFRFDQKVAKLQGKDLDRAQLPLFQHGNAIIFGGGVVNNEEAMKRINEIFGQYKEDLKQNEEK